MVTTCTIPCTLGKSSLQNSDAPIREAAKDYEEQMQQVISKWGQWTSLDTGRGHARFFSVNRRIPSAEFRSALGSNLKTPQGLFMWEDLIERVKQGYLCEYGYDSYDRGRLEMQYKSKTNIFSDCLQYDDKNVKIVGNKPSTSRQDERCQV
jgi:hypothetical protein